MRYTAQQCSNDVDELMEICLWLSFASCVSGCRDSFQKDLITLPKPSVSRLAGTNFVTQELYTKIYWLNKNYDHHPLTKTERITLNSRRNRPANLGTNLASAA